MSQVRLPQIGETAARQYHCPGEAQPISRAVHLSRLANFYSKCQECEHRSDAGEFSQQTRRQLSQRTTPRGELIWSEGFRGKYLNELTDECVRRIAAAVAAQLWSVRTPVLCSSDDQLGPFMRSDLPLIVLGHDPRPSCPNLVVAAAQALRRMSCEVVHVGRLTPACMAFATHHLEAHAGLYITGGDAEETVNGVRLLGAGGRPWSWPGRLEAVRLRMAEEPIRPSRAASMERSFQATVPYEASLGKDFTTVPPQRIAIGCPQPDIRTTLSRLLAETECDVVWAEGLHAGQEAGKVREQLRAAEAQVGFAFSRDGAELFPFTADGRLVDPANVVRWLLRDRRLRQLDEPVVVVNAQERRDVLTRLEIGSATTGEERRETSEEMYDALEQGRGVLGWQRPYQWWLCDAIPHCDNVRVLAKLLSLWGGRGPV